MLYNIFSSYLILLTNKLPCLMFACNARAYTWMQVLALTPNINFDVFTLTGSKKGFLSIN